MAEPERPRRVRAVAYPRDTNPYQRLLYAACEAAGMDVVYAGGLTGSHSLNLLLLPFELAMWRLRGRNVVHLHWLYAFGVTGSRRFPILYRVASAWFALTIAVARGCRLRIAWTAHNLLPHERVFHDDAAMERLLARAADLVIVHSPGAVKELARTLGRARRVAVIPHPPFPVDAHAPAPDGGPLRLLFFGRVAPYKGVEDLLTALARAGGELHLTVAGVCADEELAGRLSELAVPLGERVELHLVHVPEERLSSLLSEHDLLVLPFRRTTTSGTAMLGLGAGMPVAVPDTPAFEGLPAMRFQPGVEGLTDFLWSLRGGDRAALAELGDRSRAWAASQDSWEKAGRDTAGALRALFQPAGDDA